jgi:hypothetical protein
MQSKILISPVYISGPITGIENANKEDFMKMEEMLVTMGYKVRNPRKHPIPKNLPKEDIWHVMMKISLKDMICCNSMVMLNGWEFSRGAGIEFDLAKALKMPTTNQDLQTI